MRGNPRCRLIIESAECVAVAVTQARKLSGHRIKQGDFRGGSGEVCGCDLTRPAGASGFGEMRDHVRLRKRAERLERHQFRIARTDADANELAAAHIPGLAKALIAAAVMALPPMRPRTVRKGTFRGFFASASFASAAPTNPTGVPMMAAGLAAPASSNSS